MPPLPRCWRAGKSIEKADETALFQVINQLNPLVVVDESHHARSELSIEMLANFNPCFVLDLTATPRSAATSSPMWMRCSSRRSTWLSCR